MSASSITSRQKICERGFSKINLIQSDIRNKQAVAILANLMRLSLCNSDKFDSDFAFNKWTAAKSRTLMSKSVYELINSSLSCDLYMAKQNCRIIVQFLKAMLF